MSHFRTYSHQYSPSDVFGGRYKSGSASSVLAATTYGNGYNPLATPSNSKAHATSWPVSAAVSPSIWSQEHQGNTQWPAYGQGYTSGYNQAYPAASYGSNYGQTYSRRNYARQSQQSAQPQPQPQPQLQSQSQSQQPTQAAAHVTMYSHPSNHFVQPGYYNNSFSTSQAYHSQHYQQQYAASQYPPPSNGNSVSSVSMVPVIGSVPVQSNVPANVVYVPQQRVPLFMPSQSMQAVVPSNLQAYTRAPMPHYQNIGYSGVAPSTTEYDLYTCAKFCVAVASGMFPEHLSVEDSNSLERFLEMLLGATHLPKSTLLMGFVFLNQWSTLNSKVLQETDWKTRIVLSLVLANKMNDDNTFTNASWGSVTKIAPERLTKLELAWLDAMDWKMNLDQAGIQEWNYWQACWMQYEQSIHNSYLSSPASSPVGWSTGCMIEPYAMAAAC